MLSKLDDIKRQEEQIFQRLGALESDKDKQKAGQPLTPLPLFARLRALQQLRVSDDSPFASRLQRETADGEPDEFTEEELSRLGDDRAKLLREETDELKRQLELVKSRLGELSKFKEQSAAEPNNASENVAHNMQDFDVVQEAREPTESRREVAIQTVNSDDQCALQSLRPLTGKADCPNCSCDRRQSVCDTCLRSPYAIGSQAESAPRQSGAPRQSPVWSQRQMGDSNETTTRAVNQASSHDERPIRPALKYRQTGADPEKEQLQVDHSLVPGRIYTIGKSLDDKRSKLARAIEELQTMMDKVKQRGERLERERKVAQLYRQQWRYGPSIGGQFARNATAGQPSYSSRLDPELARDTNSLMGFQHVEPTMRTLRSAQQRQRPRPWPRFSKLSAQTLASRAKMVPKRDADAEQPVAAMSHLRSRSIESLHSIRGTKDQRQPAAKSKVASDKVVNHSTASAGDLQTVSIGKSASTTNLNEVAGSPEVIAEEIEEEIKEANETPASANSQKQHENETQQSRVNGHSRPRSETPEELERREQKVERMTWIPVFGETEIKTVTKRTPKRKLHVMPPISGAESTTKTTSLGGPSQSSVRISRGSILRPSLFAEDRQRGRAKSGDRVLVEAKKKLEFASNLLENERLDSRQANQLQINRNLPTKPSRSCPSRTAAPIGVKRPTPLIRAKSSLNSSNLGNASNKTSDQGDQGDQAVAKNLISETAREISRLELMISEQQKLLSLVAQNESLKEGLVKNGGACSCPCCRFDATTVKTRLACPAAAKCANSPVNRRASNMVHSLREKLNKTKARLAKTLEEERARHGRLEQKVDFSLKKQSDLANENEVLKQSLNKCIDTCLEDISSTFESLSDTLADSIAVQLPQEGNQESALQNDKIASRQSNTEHSAGSTSTSTLANAAQLISDNRHLKKMRSHIEAVERQRRGIFEELSHEKQRSQKLEFELRRSKEELDQLVEAKRRLESQLENSLENANNTRIQEQASTSKQQTTKIQPNPSTSTNSADQQGDNLTNYANKPAQEPLDDLTSQSKSFTDEHSSTFNSIDVYRQYIESMSPDLDAIRRERQMILSEFDNIKKMLTDMDK